MLALIDNYDSFTYNLYQYLCELGQEVEVVRNDKTTIEEIASWDPEHIIVSPGTVHSEGGGYLGRRDSALRATAVPGAGRVSRAPVHRGGVWWGGWVCGGDNARQVVDDPSRRQGCLQGTSEPVRGHPLPLPGNPARGFPRMPGRYRPD